MCSEVANPLHSVQRTIEIPTSTCGSEAVVIFWHHETTSRAVIVLRCQFKTRNIRTLDKNHKTSVPVDETNHEYVGLLFHLSPLVFVIAVYFHENNTMR